MQNLIQLLKSLTPIIIALVIAFVAWQGPHISASKVDAWGVQGRSHRVDHDKPCFRHASPDD